ncbi:MAG: hypothetical protein ACYTFI_20020, partial [Planctomycetota bacterium]
MNDDSRDSRPSSRRRKSFDEGPPASPAPSGQASAPGPAAPPSGAEEIVRKLEDENQMLRERLIAAEEVLHDLEGRCRQANEVSAANEQLQKEVGSLKAANAGLEQRLAARPRKPAPPDSPIWGDARAERDSALIETRPGAPEAEPGEADAQVAALMSRLNDAGRIAGQLATEVGILGEARDKLAEIEPRARLTESQLAASRAESDRFAAELKKREEEVASLKADLERIRTDAAAREAEELERREELTADLAERVATAKAMRDRAEEATKLLDERTKDLEGARGRIGELESSLAAVKAERDGLAAELKKREEALASLKADAERKEKDAETQAGVERDERERLNAEIAKRDGTIEEVRARSEETGKLLD